MTLLLTELSKAGIVMASDSAITKYIGNKIVEVDQQGWTKLLRVPRIQAAISYWGMIGAVAKKQRFDEWLEKIIQANTYSDLSSFADHLVIALNDTCNNKPLDKRYEVGVHVAGYAEWEDGIRRPVFYHVHNGHGTMEIEYITEPMGDDRKRIIAVYPKWVSEPRKLFKKYRNFPFEDKTLEENLTILDQQPILIRNGDYFFYMVIWDCLQQGFRYLNLIPNVSIPRDPDSLGSRKGLLHAALETTIRVYRCSNQSKIIGGIVTSLGITSTGYLRDNQRR